MKTLKITLIVLVALLIANVSMASAPQKSSIKQEKMKLINQIGKTISSLRFVDCVETEAYEQMVLRCTVDSNHRVVVKDIVGVNDNLKQVITKKVEQTNFKASSVLCGEKLALLLKFRKH